VRNWMEKILENEEQESYSYWNGNMGLNNNFQ
jgi:hypothetical protein